MDYQPLHTSRVDFKQFDPESSQQTLKVNVILIDTSHDGMFPVAYQFRYDVEYTDEAFSHLEPSSLRFDSESFVNLGPIQTIHKKNRVILLRNGNTVMYNHLIIISDKVQSFVGSLSKHEEFIAAYCALIDAVRTQKKLPSEAIKQQQKDTVKLSELDFKSTANLEGVESVLPVNVRKALYKKIETRGKSSISRTYTTTGKMLFELQV